MSEKFWQLSHGDGIFKQLLTAGQSIPMKLSGKKTKFSGNIFRELVSPRCCISCKIPIRFAAKAFPEGQIIGNPTICIVTPKFAWPYFVVAYILFAFILQMQLLRCICDKKETTMVITSLDNRKRPKQGFGKKSGLTFLLFWFWYLKLLNTQAF